MPITLPALLDTGASFSVFDKAVASLLGIRDISPGTSVSSVQQMRRSEMLPRYAYLHPIEIEFLGHRMRIPIGFVPSWDEGIDNLLGMHGFFEQMQVSGAACFV
jgi:hypothetical protein